MGVEMAVASAVLGLAGARQQKAAADMEAQSYREQAEMASIQARQQEEERNTQLRKQLASLGTSMSAQGVALGTSASVGAIEKSEIDIAKKDISSIKLMGMSNRRKYEISASSSKAKGKAIMLGATAKALGTGYDIYKGEGGR